ncbi:SitI3 family protein [Micromonospora sp. NPDC000207]|uniref:SitI3 family protein n=1 Tax=Micromonospora sp. NPDC000207 TaxID=3154246 RepID=UPI00331F22BA
MSVEFRLTLAGDIPLDQVARLTAASPAEQPAPRDDPQLFSARLYDQRGYAISVYPGTNGYYWAEGDNDAPWEWEPDSYVNVTFNMRADDLVDKGIPNMVATVARVLVGRDEDAALIQDGNYLLLTRTAGIVRKHRPGWWDHYHLDHLLPT